MELMKRLINGEEGQGLTEYGVLLAGVVVVVVAAVATLGGNMTALFTSIQTKITTLLGTM